MKGKRGVMGEAVMTIYRVVFVTVIAVVIFLISNLAYSYEVNTRDSEAMILSRLIVDCVTVDGPFDLNSLSETDRADIFSFCGFRNSLNKNVFVSLEFKDGETEIDKIIAGRDDLIWVKRIYTSELKTTSIKEYEPGYFNGIFLVNVLKNDELVKTEMLVEVIINNEN